jgi:hypothetical protein
VTNLDLFRRILSNADFEAGQFDTGFLERMLAARSDSDIPEEHTDIAAIAAALFTALPTKSDPASVASRQSTAGSPGQPDSAWRRAALQEAVRGRE